VRGRSAALAGIREGHFLAAQQRLQIGERALEGCEPDRRISQPGERGVAAADAEHGASAGDRLDRCRAPPR